MVTQDFVKVPPLSKFCKYFHFPETKFTEMKVLRVVSVACCFWAASCSDSDGPNTFEIRNEQVIYIDNDQSAFEQGDYLWFNIRIPTSQTDAATGKALDIYRLTKASDTFFGFSLFALDADGAVPVRFEAGEIIIETGNLNVIDYREPANTELLGVAHYNDGQYEMRAGIPLKNKGEFFVANSQLGAGTQGMAFNPANGSDFQITLTTKIQGSDTDGRYFISVN